MKSVGSPKRANNADNSSNSSLNISSTGSGKDEMISTNLSTLKGALNPPHPPRLPGRESVMQDLTPLDDENFYRNGIIPQRRHNHARRNNGCPTGTHPWRGPFNSLDRRQLALNASPPSLNSSRMGISTHDSSTYAANDICAQIASQSLLVSQVSQMIKAHAFQTQVRAILDPNPPDSIFSSPKVVRNVSQVQLNAGFSSNAQRRRRRTDSDDHSKHRLNQTSYMRMLHEKYESIRLWKDVTGHVEVKYKKVDMTTNPPTMSEYIDLYPEDSYENNGIVHLPCRSSPWYEGALLRARPGSIKDFVGHMHSNRLKSVMDLELICEGLSKDPWMYDDLVYIFVNGTKRRRASEEEDPSQHCDGYISMPTLPPHFMDDELLAGIGPKIQVSPWSQTAARRRSENRQRSRQMYGDGEELKFAEEEQSSSSSSNRANRMNNVQGSSGQSTRTPKRSRNKNTIDVEPNRKEETNSRGVSKYTTQLMTLPEIVVITSNGRSGNADEKKQKKEKETKNNSNKSRRGKRVMEPLVLGDAEDLKERIEFDRSAQHSVFEVPDDVASEESLFRKVNEVIDQRGDLSGSSDAPSLTETHSASPHVRFDAQRGWGDKICKEDEERFDEIGATMEEQRFIRRDLWSASEECKDTGFSLFPSIWRTDDSIF